MKVVNMRTQRCDIPIDRTTRWGNPFPLHLRGQTSAELEADRTRVLAHYRVYLDQEIAAGRVTNDDLLTLHGKTCGCWCKPLPCHGDILKEKVDAAVKAIDLEPITYGDVMTVQEFQTAVSEGAFIPYDGVGHLAIGDQVSNVEFDFDNPKIPAWATHVVWYNR